MKEEARRPAQPKEMPQLAQTVETKSDAKCFTKFDEVFSDWLAEHGLDASAEDEALCFEQYAREIYSSASYSKRRRINDDDDDDVTEGTSSCVTEDTSSYSDKIL